eukprot:CAMPEP_0183320406 /NCGR_PEP_ID=MMETSP0160_2-20130417/66178_1 /TAXON_ID=2839 ORGANISM="Odontella Sinensis, Strain Grunow 1884" /NCGR_SAMPLE_ID=MMETSP0160_2 /ASSEMBLY_ACC=CAM_ASM_000250 /LENGTH=49 /DNA_ID= /DNA_START= /DNA_END= /DNA_ORIENTATION=
MKRGPPGTSAAVYDRFSASADVLALAKKVDRGRENEKEESGFGEGGDRR